MRKNKDWDEFFARLEEYHRKTEESHRKTEESHRETEESQRKTEKSVRETQESVRELRKSIQEANGNFNRKWGDFMENLVEGDLVSLLRNWGLKMIDAEIRPIPKATVSRDDGTTKYEYDLIVKNGDYAIIVEVKTTLTIPKIDKFLKKLSTLKDDLPAYKNKTIYACMAYLTTEKDGKDKGEDRTLTHAEEKGLFLIKAPGGPSRISRIENSKGFIPRKF